VTVQTRKAQSEDSGGLAAGKRGDIQGLRCIAVVMVVLFHAGLPIPGGFAGVDVFFVISGFVITEQLQRLHQTGRFTFARFYARRMRRLLPAMMLMIATTVVASVLFQSPLGPQQTMVKTAIGALLMIGNGVVLLTTGGYFDSAAEANPLLHVWSLSVEEQFYLIFPAAFVVGWSLGMRHARVLIATLTGASFVGAMALTYGSFQVRGNGSAEFAFYSSPSRAWEFGVGALLAMGAAGLVSARARISARYLGTAGVVGLIATAVLVTETMPWPAPWTIVPVAATALLLVAGGDVNGWTTRRLSSRPFVFIGDLSYSIYLWHWPFIVFARLLWHDSFWAPVLAALASLGPAWLSYVYVETRYRRPATLRSRRVLAIGVCGTLAASAGLYTMQASSTGLIQDFDAYQNQRHALTYGRSTDCMLNRRAYEPGDIERCTTTIPNSQGWILLVGDSHADAISTGTIDAATRLGYDTVALTGAGCAFSRTAPPNSLMPNCSALASALLDKATGPDKPALVVMTHWVAPRLEIEPNWLQRLRAPLAELARADIPVLFALDVPNFGTEGGGEPSACHGGIANFSCESTEGSILAHQGRSRAAEMDLIAGRPGVTAFDPWSTFCTEGRCSAIVGGRLGYWDFDHLNGIGSSALAERMAVAMRDILE
jgi:peptidoglycan/LPS O-acetylase OafA/YrhL